MKLSTTIVAPSVIILAAQATPASQCNICVQCCNSIQPSNSTLVSVLAGVLGIAPVGANVPVGVNCTLIIVVGVGYGVSCDANPVCCQNNDYGGLIHLDCNPVNLSL